MEDIGEMFGMSDVKDDSRNVTELVKFVLENDDGVIAVCVIKIVSLDTTAVDRTTSVVRLVPASVTRGGTLT